MWRISKGLRVLCETARTTGVQSNHAPELRMQLTALASAQAVGNMDFSGFNLQELRVDGEGQWVISVNGN